MSFREGGWHKSTYYFKAIFSCSRVYHLPVHVVVTVGVSNLIYHYWPDIG